MKCIQCGTHLDRETPHRLPAVFRGTDLHVEVIAPSCPQCGRVALVGKAMRAYGKAIAEAYRREKDLLTIAEIEMFRQNLGMTQKEFADYVFVGIATLKRWMRGEIQTEAYDKLVRLRVDPMYLQETRDALLAKLAVPLCGDAGFDVPRQREPITVELSEGTIVRAGAA